MSPLHIRKGRSPFTICGSRVSDDDIDNRIAMYLPRGFMVHVGICGSCADRFRYPPYRLRVASKELPRRARAAGRGYASHSDARQRLHGG